MERLGAGTFHRQIAPNSPFSANALRPRHRVGSGQILLLFTAKRCSDQRDESEREESVGFFSIGHDHERRGSVAVKRAPKVYSHSILLDRQECLVGLD
jgi:hypothetical protein